MTTGHACIALDAWCSPQARRLSGRRLGCWKAAALAGLIAVLAGLLAAQNAGAQGPGTTVRVPLTIDYIALSAALREQLYTDKGRARLWDGSNRCEYLYAENPVLSRDGAQVRLETNAALSVGFVLGTRCVSPIWWSGIIAAETRPYIGPGMNLKLRITDLDLYNDQHKKTLIVGKGFDLVKQYFIPRIETFSFALKPATEQLADLAEAASPPDAAARVKRAIATLRAEPDVAATDGGVRVVLDITVPAFAAASAPPPAALTPAELAAFETELNQWDAFLVFSIKQFGSLKLDPELRSDLLNLLLDSRYRLVKALASPRAGGPDPVRVLFIKEWQRLSEIIRSASRRGTLGDRSLEFLSFISAGDALFALDQAAPALGMRISADDLRRLAHIIAPEVKADPLAFSFKEDPELRKMFNVAEPLAEEGPLDTSPTELPEAAGTVSSSTPSPAPSAAASSSPAASALATTGRAAATPSGARAAPTPSAAPSAAPAAPRAGPVSMLAPFIGLFIPDSAFGSEGGADASRMVVSLQRLGAKLKRAVPTSSNADVYRADMGKLLQLSGERQLADSDSDDRYRDIYMRLIRATAWQESCWRQFVVKRRRVVYLASSTGDIGLMQVNKYVWRGFYSVPRLEWDVLYNASAGTGILERLLQQVATKPGATSRGKPNELARSVYAAYNGGPGAYRRWRRPEPRAIGAIDRSFWSKYRWVLHGVPIDILKCSAEWGHSPGH